MPGLGDYEKKKKGERGFKMNGPLFYKDGPLFEKKKHFLERDAAGPIADVDYGMHGEYDDSEHNIHARKTEGTIAEQEARRNDRSAPGFNSMDADSYIRGQMLRNEKSKN